MRYARPVYAMLMFGCTGYVCVHVILIVGLVYNIRIRMYIYILYAIPSRSLPNLLLRVFSCCGSQQSCTCVALCHGISQVQSRENK